MLVHQFKEDVLLRKFDVLAIEEEEFKLAAQLLELYGFDLPLRSLDALQLAVAVSLRARRPVDHFVASDKALCEVAEREGFAVLNLEGS